MTECMIQKFLFFYFLKARKKVSNFRPYIGMSLKIGPQYMYINDNYNKQIINI